VRFEIGDWVESEAVNHKGKFVGQVVDIMNAQYVIRDAERRKWLRQSRELKHAKAKETV
jgi:hypothetical protein